MTPSTATKTQPLFWVALAAGQLRSEPLMTAISLQDVGGGGGGGYVLCLITAETMSDSWTTSLTGTLKRQPAMEAVKAKEGEV